MKSMLPQKSPVSALAYNTGKRTYIHIRSHHFTWLSNPLSDPWTALDPRHLFFCSSNQPLFCHICIPSFTYAVFNYSPLNQLTPVNICTQISCLCPWNVTVKLPVDMTPTGVGNWDFTIERVLEILKSRVGADMPLNPLIYLFWTHTRTVTHMLKLRCKAYWNVFVIWSPPPPPISMVIQLDSLVIDRVVRYVFVCTIFSGILAL